METTRCSRQTAAPSLSPAVQAPKIQRYMATAKDQLFHLIEQLSETDAAKLVSDLHRNAPPERMLGERFNASTDDFRNQRGARLR